MLLCDEFAIRKGFSVGTAKCVKKGFAFFGENNNLLVIKWIDQGIGFYEISECLLEKKIKTLKLNNIEWKNYENFIKNWAISNRIVTDKKIIFHLAWEYYIRRNQDFFIKNYGPIKIFPTIDDKNPNRILDSIFLLENISTNHKNIFDLWSNKISEIISLYCYWLCEVKKD